MSLEIMAYSALVIWFAYLVYGLTGFGSGLVAVPILAHFVPLQFVVPYILVLNVSASMSMISKQDFRRQTNWRELLPLLPFGIVGMITGTFLLLNMPQGWLLLGLGIFIFIFGIRNLLGIRGDRLISKLWAVPAGFLGGTVGALFSTSGPPYVIYLTHRLRDPAQLRSSFSALIMLESGLRLIVFLFAGLVLQEDMIPALLLAFPLMWFGLYVGNRIHLGVSKHQLLKIIGMLLTASGFSLFFRSDVLYKLF
ncbi:MAG: sulfite exporter TauE/SafE family protein [Burkholderiales bacterium]|nr:sulfite exporter TauE/SafE family protein [Burkholderiales bacterium]